MDFSLPAKERLKGKKVLDTVFQKGKSINAYPLKLWYVAVDDSQDVRFRIGVNAPKRKFKSAVKRNRIKRLLREAYRLNKALFFNKVEGRYALFFLYLGDTAPTYKDMDAHMKKAAKAFIRKEKHEKNIP